MKPKTIILAAAMLSTMGVLSTVDAGQTTNRTHSSHSTTWRETTARSTYGYQSGFVSPYQLDRKKPMNAGCRTGFRSSHGSCSY